MPKTYFLGAGLAASVLAATCKLCARTWGYLGRLSEAFADG